MKYWIAIIAGLFIALVIILSSIRIGEPCSAYTEKKLYRGYPPAEITIKECRH